MITITARADFLQKVASFAAPDPWNVNRPATFCIEDYVMIAGPSPDKPLPPDSLRVKLMEHRFAIRSEPGGAAHFLPESLVKLWRTGKVQVQELPRLLAGLEPGLRKRSDYYESSSAWVVRWGNRLVGGLAMAGLLYWLGDIMLDRRYSDLKGWGALAFVAFVICGPIEFVYLRQARRRARQKRWALEQAGRH